MADDPLTNCPECDVDSSLRKVINSVGVVFKGSGFYVTDSRGKKSAATPPANGKSSENGSSVKADGESSSTKESGDSKASAPEKSKKKSEKTAA